MKMMCQSFDFRRFPHATRAGGLLTTTALLTTMLAGAGSLQAATYDVLDGENLNPPVVAVPPAAGDVWTLQGNATVFSGAAAAYYGVQLPTGAANALTINGAAGGSTVTLNDGAGHTGYFYSRAATTVNLSNVTFTGGNNGDAPTTGAGGVIYNGNGGLTLNTSGAVAFTNNTTAFDTVTSIGGALYTNSLMTINVSGSLAITDNSALGFGGGVYALTGLRINNTGQPAITVTNNASLTRGGGGLNAGNGVTITGGANISQNTAIEDGGGIRSVGGDVSIATASGDVILSGNSASRGPGYDAQLSYDGGGIVAYRVGAADGNVILGNNAGIVTITGNTVGYTTATSGVVATLGSRGGAIYADGATNIVGTVITLSGNHATGQGGGIYAGEIVSLMGDQITVTDNSAIDSGGAIYAGGNITLGNTAGGILTLTGNTAGGSGGAISSGGNVNLAAGSGNISLTNNTAGNGGAIYSTGMTTITGETITLSGNHANSSSSIASGGAISAGGVNLAGTAITLVDNQANSSSGFAVGGAINSSLGEPVTITGGTITLVGNRANSGSSFTQGGAIASSGAVTIGGAGSSITLSDNHAIGTSGSSGGAIFAVGSASITGFGEISNNTTTGFGGAIIVGASPPFFSNGNVTLTASGGNLLVSGNQAGDLGGAIQMDAGTVDLEATDGSITFSHNIENTAGTAQANAIYLGNALGGSEVILNAAAGHAITFFDPIQNDAANGLVSVVAKGGGTVTFDGSQYTNVADRWSQLYGDTEVQSGTIFAVQNNAIYGALAADVGGAAGGSSFTVDNGATLAGGIAGEVRADNFALNGTLNIAGSAVPGSALGGFSTFTVTSNNVVFGAGSQVLFNTYLNDASIQRTDLLTLDLNGSATTGTADVRVTNVGGAGAITVGNGIELVQVTNNNGTTVGAFTLAVPVVAGPYEYTLFRGSVDASGPENWYLRSTLDCTLEPNAAACQQGPSQPPVGPTPPPETPHYRIETSLDAALPSMALLYGRTLMDTLHERVGEEEDLRGRKGLHQDGPYTGGWARLIGTGGKQQGDPLGIYGSGPQYSYGFVGLQGGQDLIRREHDDGSRDHAGITFAVGSAHGDVTHFDGTTGNDDFQAYTLGGYWTHFGAPGWYVDTMLQGTLYDARTTANRGLLPLKTKGDGIAGSVEAGYPFRFSNGYFIEPQAQLIYQTINFNNALDNAAVVKFGNVDSLIGRLGARFGRTWSLDGNVPGARLITAWIRPNVWQEFRGNPITQFSSATGFIPFRADLGGTWGEIDVGVSGQINLNTTLFANASYQSRFDGGGFAYDGKAGVRVNW